MSNAAIIVDVESTGFENEDDITQISILVVDDNLQLVESYSSYFDTDIAISPKVESVTGVNNIKLKTLSNGLYLEDKIHEFFHLFQRGLPIIAHNAIFDKRMMVHNFLRAGFELPHAETICTMNTLTDVMNMKGKFGEPKYPRLSEAFAYVSKQTGVSRKKYDEYFITNFNRAINTHDAVYDTYITYVLYRYIKLYL